MKQSANSALSSTEKDERRRKELMIKIKLECVYEKFFAQHLLKKVAD